VDHDKFAIAGLPLASPFHEKKSFADEPTLSSKEQIKNYFNVSKNSKKSKE